MIVENFIARSAERTLLKEVEASKKSEFVAIYGRRRIGKTYLVNQHFANHPFFFKFTGTRNKKLPGQLEKFMRKLKKLAQQQGISNHEKAETWDDALELLGELIEKSKTQKKVIFLDELPWIASRKSGFMEALDYFWNDFLSVRSDVILIVCGSAANWMIKHVIDETGGLHNRITRTPIHLQPFTLGETRDYLISKGIHLNFEQITELYMTTGGVAYYLDRVKSGESAAQFISGNFFGPMGDLQNEFTRLFRSLFKDHQRHISVIRKLAKHPNGYSRTELLKEFQGPDGGSFSIILEELEQSDFVRFIPKIGNKKRDGVYRLVDEFTLFYLTWVAPLGKNNQDPAYWLKQLGTPKYNSWLGSAFENVCLKHSEQIKMALNLSFFSTSVHTFHDKQTQIDMIIDTNDKVMSLCEMKYTISSFEMSELEAKKIRTRRDHLLASLKRKKQIMVVLVTALEAKRNQHYVGLVNREVNLPSLFSVDKRFS